MSVENPISPPESIRITPDTLFRDSRSAEAKRRTASWSKAKKDQRLKAVFSCSDSRAQLVNFVSTFNIAQIGRIAAGSTIGPFFHFSQHNGSNIAIVLTHYDGVLMEEHGIPAGCGGQGEKHARMSSDTQRQRRGIEGYIDTHIVSHDVIAQSYALAQEVAGQTEKPVLAATIDHRMGVVAPLVYFGKGGRRRESGVDLSLVEKVLKEPGDMSIIEEIYRKGMPQLDLEEVFETTRDGEEMETVRELMQFLEDNRQVAELLVATPGFIDSQKTINPDLVILTTTPMSSAIRFPNTCGRSNSAFTLSVPYRKNDEGDPLPPRAGDMTALASQLKYPIENAADAQNPVDKFSRTKTLYIETPRLDWSHYAAGRLVERYQWMKDWIAAGGHILTGEIASGQVLRIEQFNPTV